MRTRLVSLIAVLGLVGGGVVLASVAPAGAHGRIGARPKAVPANVTTFDLTPSTPAIAACLPDLKATVTVTDQTNETGRDRFRIQASGLPANQDFTVFLLETPGSPFGAAEYIGDFSTNDQGRGGNGGEAFKLIVAEAFSSTLVNGMRVRAELNHVGFWFADPAGDDVCFGPGGGAVTPFDGDNEAGVQVMNSSNALPGFPLPLP